MLLPDVILPSCSMIRRFSIVVLMTFVLSHAQVERHPYAFERPMSNRDSHIISHKLGVPFVERKTDSVENQKVVEKDSEEYLVDHTERLAPERDRSSSPGEFEIRSKILRNSTNSGERKKDKNVVEAKSSVEVSPLDLSQNSTADDLATSQNVPVPMSLKGNKDAYYRLKQQKSENSKPKPKHRKPIIEYADDDEYYYVYDDDDYYDVDLPPKKASNGRKNFDTKSRMPQSYYSSSPSKDLR
jgi:hypothetical protein